MSTIDAPDFAQIEEEAIARLASEAGDVEADVERAAEAPEIVESLDIDSRNPGRLAVAVGLPTVAAAIMVGGVFTGFSPRVYAIIGGLLGVGLAMVARRIRKPLSLNLTIVAGLFLIGLIVVLPSGFSNVLNVRSLASTSYNAGQLLRPPVPWTPGWQAIVGWLMGILGFGAVWVAIVVKRPALGLMIPLPVAAIAAISVPSEQQVASGLTVLALFGVALGVLSSAQTLGDDDQRLPLAYELRKAGKSAAVLIPVLIGLFLLAQTNFLFPKPVIDPTEKPQHPHTTPLSEVPDRVLFEVRTKSPVVPFRMGSLDIYDGTAWLLAPLGSNRIKDVPRDGIVDRTLTPSSEADFVVDGLTGAVLPSLPDTIGIVAQGPKLAWDSRSGNIRVSQGQAQSGIKYSLTAQALPTVQELQRVVTPIPADLEQFTQIPSPPPAVVDLIAKAPKTSKWDEWDFLRRYVLDHVVVTGLGQPVDVPPSRVQDMLAGSKQGSPFEIVAAEAMMGRWAGVPARIGYGYKIDRYNPEQSGGFYQLRPKNGVTFPEVFFPGYGWLPVIGDPKQAKPQVSTNNIQQSNPNVQPSNDIAVQLFLPEIVPPKSVFLQQLKVDILIAIPIVLLLLLLYALYPGLRKARLRSRRRALGLAAGPRARVIVAYAEWRDFATDFGFGYGTDTPLMFLQRFIDDDEHAELAWLVTRTLWGDLQHDIGADTATWCEELSRSLRRRLGQAQPATVRFLAVISRLSLRSPFAADLDAILVEPRRELPPGARRTRIEQHADGVRAVGELMPGPTEREDDRVGTPVG